MCYGIRAMAQQLIDGVTPIQSHAISSEYKINCGNDISVCIQKEAAGCNLLLQKGRTKLTLSLEEWRSICANCETIELGYMLLTGNLGRVHE